MTRHIPVLTNAEPPTVLEGHLMLTGTGVELVAYAAGRSDLVVTVNKNGRCVFSATLMNVFDRGDPGSLPSRVERAPDGSGRAPDGSGRAPIAVANN